MTSFSGTIHVMFSVTSLAHHLQKLAPHLHIKHISTAGVRSSNTLNLELDDPEEVEVLTGCSWDLVAMLKTGLDFPNLKWIHSLSAGVADLLEHFTQTQINSQFIITRSEVASESVSQYVIGQILAHRRRFCTFHDQQKTRVWDRGIETSPMTLRHFTVVILGVGQIGEKTAALCAAFGMTVYGVTRTPVKQGHGSPHVNHYSLTSELNQTLAKGDYIVNTLPSTPLTTGLLDNDTLRVCHIKKPVLINVGRGDIISEESILKAVRNGWISGAVLDVFPVEPLPVDSLLWREPNISVTPHVALSTSPEFIHMTAQSVVENYERLVNHQPLHGLVDVNAGY